MANEGVITNFAAVSPTPTDNYAVDVYEASGATVGAIANQNNYISFIMHT